MHNLTFKINFHIKKNLLIYIEICPTAVASRAVATQSGFEIRELKKMQHNIFL